MRWLAAIGIVWALSVGPAWAQQAPSPGQGAAPASNPGQGAAPAACAPHRVTPAESYPGTLIDTPSATSGAAHCAPAENPPSAAAQNLPNCTPRGAAPAIPLAGQSPTAALECAELAGSQTVLFPSQAQPTSSTATCEPGQANNTSSNQNDSDDTNSNNNQPPPCVPTPAGVVTDLPAQPNSPAPPSQ